MSIPRSSIVPALFLSACLASTATAQAPAPSRLERAPEEVANSTTSGRTGRPVPDDLPVNRVVKVSARLVGPASPGLKVTLDGSATTGGRVWFRWLQTQGPKVVLDDSTKPEVHFTIPTDARRLEFVLVAGDSTGVDAQIPGRRRRRPRARLRRGGDEGRRRRRPVGEGRPSGPAQRQPERPERQAPLPVGPGRRAQGDPQGGRRPDDLVRARRRPAPTSSPSSSPWPAEALSEPSMVTVTVAGTARALGRPGRRPRDGDRRAGEVLGRLDRWGARSTPTTSRRSSTRWPTRSTRSRPTSTPRPK